MIGSALKTGKNDTLCQHGFLSMTKALPAERLLQTLI